MLYRLSPFVTASYTANYVVSCLILAISLYLSGWATGIAQRDSECPGTLRFLARFLNLKAVLCPKSHGISSLLSETK
jgi:hypothetical protein